MLGVLGLSKQSVWIALPLTGFAIGWWLDLQETKRMTRFRDRSALYYRQVEKPSWP
jgi:hypothetical protein